VFQRADAIDQAGNADRTTAQTFYAAASFFEILKQFNESRELDPDIKQMAIYAKWKAAEILKALKEGRKPLPGGYSGGGSSEQETEQSAVGSSFVSSPAPHDNIPIARPSASITTPPVSTPAQIARPATSGAPVASPPVDPRRTETFTRQLSSLPKSRKADCLEYIKFARAALEADDVQLTVERLQAALSLLHDG